MNEAAVEVMEADSTTLETDNGNDGKPKGSSYFFIKHPRNIAWYEENVVIPNQTQGASGLITNLQRIGILAPEMMCTLPCTAQTQCKKARVQDEMQWQCAACKKNKSIRENSMFKNSYCKLSEAMIILAAWSEDVDENFTAEELGIKPRYVSSLYDKLDILAAAEHCSTRLGGSDCVVLVELYPATPPYTEIMLTDTKNVPPRYWLNALTFQQMKIENNNNNAKKFKYNSDGAIVSMITSVVRSVVNSGGSCVIGESASKLEGINEALIKVQRFTDVKTINDLEPTCPTDLLLFLRDGIWRQARSICSAANNDPGRQRYLHASLYRLAHNADGFLPVLMRLVAERRTANS